MGKGVLERDVDALITNLSARLVMGAPSFTDRTGIIPLLPSHIELMLPLLKGANSVSFKVNNDGVILVRIIGTAIPLLELHPDGKVYKWEKQGEADG
jgi:hypothetical protein